MAAFDAPDRETCVVRRARTNTPMQALLLLNDPTYVEAARKLAERVMLSSTGNQDRVSNQDRVALAFRIVLTRSPGDTEKTALLQILDESHAHFAATPAAADELLGVGQSGRHDSLNPVDLAAWTTAMSVLLNLDESISKL